MGEEDDDRKKELKKTVDRYTHRDLRNYVPVPSFMSPFMVGAPENLRDLHPRKDRSQTEETEQLGIPIYQ